MTWVEAELSALRTEFPAHDIWHVRAYMGPDGWCAKPKDARVSTCVEHSPDELRSAIKAELEQMDPAHAKELARMPRGVDG